jgi:hypothetical protein
MIHNEYISSLLTEIKQTHIWRVDQGEKIDFDKAQINDRIQIHINPGVTEIYKIFNKIGNALLCLPTVNPNSAGASFSPEYNDFFIQSDPNVEHLDEIKQIRKIPVLKVKDQIFFTYRTFSFQGTIQNPQDEIVIFVYSTDEKQVLIDLLKKYGIPSHMWEGNWFHIKSKYFEFTTKRSELDENQQYVVSLLTEIKQTPLILSQVADFYSKIHASTLDKKYSFLLQLSQKLVNHFGLLPPEKFRSKLFSSDWVNKPDKLAEYFPYLQSEAKKRGLLNEIKQIVNKLITYEDKNGNCKTFIDNNHFYYTAILNNGKEMMFWSSDAEVLTEIQQILNDKKIPYKNLPNIAGLAYRLAVPIIYFNIRRIDNLQNIQHLDEIKQLPRRIDILELRHGNYVVLDGTKTFHGYYNKEYHIVNFEFGRHDHGDHPFARFLIKNNIPYNVGDFLDADASRLTIYSVKDIYFNFKTVDSIDEIKQARKVPAYLEKHIHQNDSDTLGIYINGKAVIGEISYKKHRVEFSAWGDAQMKEYEKFFKERGILIYKPVPHSLYIAVDLNYFDIIDDLNKFDSLREIKQNPIPFVLDSITPETVRFVDEKVENDDEFIRYYIINGYPVDFGSDIAEVVIYPKDWVGNDIVDIAKVSSRTIHSIKYTLKNALKNNKIKVIR